MKKENNIQRLLRQKHMTEKDLAQKAGIRREYLHRIVLRKVIPSVHLGMCIAETLGVQIEDLFSLKNNFRGRDIEST